MDMQSKRAQDARIQQESPSSGPSDAITSRAFTISPLKHSCEPGGSTFLDFFWFCYFYAQVTIHFFVIMLAFNLYHGK